MTSHCLLVATARFAQTPEAAADNACFECQSHESLWICLVCGHVGCGRYVERHAFAHFQVSLDVQCTPAQAKRATTFEVCVHMFYMYVHLYDIMYVYKQLVTMVSSLMSLMLLMNMSSLTTVAPPRAINN